MPRRPIDPKVYRYARGSGYAAAVAFLQIALFGYLAFCIYYITRRPVQVLGAVSCLWSVLLPAWCAIMFFIYTDKLTSIISTFVGVCGFLSLITFGILAGSSLPAEKFRDFGLMNIAALAAATCAGEFLRSLEQGWFYNSGKSQLSSFRGAILLSAAALISLFTGDALRFIVSCIASFFAGVFFTHRVSNWRGAVPVRAMSAAAFAGLAIADATSVSMLTAIAVSFISGAIVRAALPKILLKKR